MHVGTIREVLTVLGKLQSVFAVRWGTSVIHIYHSTKQSSEASYAVLMVSNRGIWERNSKQ